jgi:hypothetical protein
VALEGGGDAECVGSEVGLGAGVGEGDRVGVGVGVALGDSERPGFEQAALPCRQDAL